jgi:hypothetical protein
MKKPILIDQLIHNYSKNSGEQVEIDGKWYVAKGIPFCCLRHFLMEIPRKIYHAWLIIIGRAFAVQFIEDRKKR